jgi:Acetyltransferase (GNAT) domain
LNGLSATESTNKTERSLQAAREADEGYWLDPLRDPRWPRFVERHSCASVFHTREWLEALHRTYGYSPLVFTKVSPGGELTNGWAFCDVNSWLTGRRLVSLPFSDHCNPLLESEGDLPIFLSLLEKQFTCGQWKEIQVRPQGLPMGPESSPAHFAQGEHYFLHKVDLRPSLDQIVGRFHKDSIGRKIRRAERERLAYEMGSSEKLIQAFYRLLFMTRRRHHVPPQPLAWFRNLAVCMGDKMRISVCYKDSLPIASMLTLTHNSSMVYKYGCSDARFHNLGGMPYLFLKAIEEAKQIGALELDLGRSDSDNAGLATFKERLGGKRSLLTYWGYPGGLHRRRATDWKVRACRGLLRRMPYGVLAMTGRALYKHAG